METYNHLSYSHLNRDVIPLILKINLNLENIKAKYFSKYKKAAEKEELKAFKMKTDDEFLKK